MRSSAGQQLNAYLVMSLITMNSTTISNQNTRAKMSTWVKLPDCTYDLGVVIFIVDRRKMMLLGVDVTEAFKDSPEALHDRFEMLIKNAYPSIENFQIIQIQWSVEKQAFSVCVTHERFPAIPPGAYPLNVVLGDLFGMRVRS